MLESRATQQRKETFRHGRSWNRQWLEYISCFNALRKCSAEACTAPSGQLPITDAFRSKDPGWFKRTIFFFEKMTVTFSSAEVVQSGVNTSAFSVVFVRFIFCLWFH